MGATEKRKSGTFAGLSVISIFYGGLEFLLTEFAAVSKETTSLPRRTRLSHFDAAVADTAVSLPQRDPGRRESGTNLKRLCLFARST